MFSSALIVSECVRPLRAAALICSRTWEDCHNCSRYAGCMSVGRTRTRVIVLGKLSSCVSSSTSTPCPRRSGVPALRQTRKSPARTSTGGGPPTPALSTAGFWCPFVAIVSSGSVAGVGRHPPLAAVVLDPPLINRLPRTLASRTCGQPEANSVADTGHPPSSRPHRLGTIFRLSAPKTPRVGPAQRPRSHTCAAISRMRTWEALLRSELRNAKFGEELPSVRVHGVEHCAADGSTHQYAVGVTKPLRQDFVGVDSDGLALHPVPVQGP